MSRPLKWEPSSSILPAAEQQFDTEIVKGVAFDAFQFIEVTFGAADTDLDIPHTLAPVDPESLGYIVLRADRATSIYHDQSGTRRPWTRDYIVLRSGTADAVVTLLIVKPHLRQQR